jgi:hypothetical protein
MMGMPFVVSAFGTPPEEDFSHRKLDGFVKSPRQPFSVIPAKAGIQSFQGFLDSRLRGSDDLADFLRDRQTFNGAISPIKRAFQQTRESCIHEMGFKGSVGVPIQNRKS